MPIFLKKYPRFLTIIVLIVGHLYVVNAQQKGDAFSKFNNLDDDKERFELFFTSSDRYVLSSASLWEAKVAEYMEASLKEKDTVAANYYKVILSQIHYDMGNYDKSVILANELYQSIRDIEDTTKNVLLDIMDGSYSELQLYDKQLEIRKEKKAMGDSKVSLYDIYANLGLYKQARISYVMEEGKDLVDGDHYNHALYDNKIGEFLLLDGTTYTANKHFNMALSYIDLYLNDYNTEKTEAQQKEAIFLQGKIKANIGKSYMAMRKYNEAIPLLEAGAKSSKVYDQGKYLLNTLNVWKDLARCHLELKNLESAKAYLDSVRFNTVNDSHLQDFNKLMADYFVETNEPELAAQHYRAFIRIKDSIERISNKKKIDGLVAEYDLESQKETIEQQRLDIQKTMSEIEAQDKKINYGIIALVFTLLGLGGLILAYRRSIRSQKLIEEQKKIIEDSLVEKDSLLKEIHHRVKNNLQMVSSLLSLQTKNTKSKAAIEALEEGKSRVKAMALIHQKLYQNEDLSVIEMQGYIESLVTSVQSVYKMIDSPIDIVIDAENTELDIDRAIPIGLILNELVSNSYKYAFPENPDSGKIYINISEIEEGDYYFEYSDNGVGLRENNSENGDKGSMGMHLIQRLVNQLRSKLNIESNNGNGVKFWFNFS
jgi:two-component sensor histidine kinase